MPPSRQTSVQSSQQSFAWVEFTEDDAVAMQAAAIATSQHTESGAMDIDGSSSGSGSRSKAAAPERETRSAGVRRRTRADSGASGEASRNLPKPPARGAPAAQPTGRKASTSRQRPFK